MMTIHTDKRSVSVVLTEEIIEKLDRLVRERDYESRSEAIRKLLRKGKGLDFSDKKPEMGKTEKDVNRKVFTTLITGRRRKV